MQLEQLRYANEIAKCGSFTKAAQTLFISQPSLTISIKKLEDELGFTLFKRSSKGTQITKKGEEALGTIKDILDLVESLRTLSPNFNENAQAMSLIVFPTLFDLLEPEFNKKVHDIYPNICFSLLEQSANSILQNAQLGILDYAISGNPSPVYEKIEKQILASCLNINFEILFEEPLLLLLPSAHPLLRKQELFINDLSEQTFLYYDEHIINNTPNILDGYSVSLKQVIPFHRRTSIIKALLLNQGITIMTYSQYINSKSLMQNKITPRKISDFRNTFTHYLIYNKRYIFSKVENDIIDLVKKFYLLMKKTS